tara:strand:+ start:77 stop:442 length:366 start_codon:yes stop_codon:yes gene_type:complete
LLEQETNQPTRKQNKSKEKKKAAESETEDTAELCGEMMDMGIIAVLFAEIRYNNTKFDLFWFFFHTAPLTPLSLHSTPGMHATANDVFHSSRTSKQGEQARRASKQEEEEEGGRPLPPPPP